MSTAPQASLNNRLLDMAEAARRRSLELPVGNRRDALLRKAEDIERSAALEASGRMLSKTFPTCSMR
jgi:hypothetical protein